jgi:glycosyltransferase involved in cell wall biosynthesis
MYATQFFNFKFSKLRIGIDAKWYFSGTISGRIVIVNLLQAIANSKNEHKFIVILDDKDKDKKFPFSSHPNFEIVYCKTFTNQFTNFFSFITLLPYRLDVCVYQYFAPLFSSFKRVIYIHDIIFESNPEYFSQKEKVYFKIMKMMARRADGIVTVSRTEEKRLRRFSYVRKQTKLVAIHNGIGNQFHNLPELDNETKQRVKERYELPDRYILYLGRINERKNIPLLIKAFANIKFKDISLVIAGESHWSKVDIKQVIVKEGLADRVKFTGFIQDEDITTVYQLASVFSFLSFDEGFGLPVAEAMACSVPVVVSDTPIHREICQDAGIYTNPFNFEEVAQAIDIALSREAIVKEKIRLGKQIVNNYRWNSAAQKLLEFVENL